MGADNQAARERCVVVLDKVAGDQVAEARDPTHQGVGLLVEDQAEAAGQEIRDARPCERRPVRDAVERERDILRGPPSSADQGQERVARRRPGGEAVRLADGAPLPFVAQEAL